MIAVLSAIVAVLVSAITPCETTWIEYDHDAGMFVGVCGDGDGQAIAPLVANHSHVQDVRW